VNAATTDPLAVLLALTRHLNEEPGLDEAVGAVARAGLQLLGATRASVRVLDEGGARLLSVARAGEGAQDPAPPFDARRGVVGWVIANIQATRVVDCAADPRFEHFPHQRFTMRSMVLAPLHMGPRVVGAFAASHPTVDHFTARDEALAALLANTAVARIEQARLERLAHTDELTRALNRRSLLPRLTQEIARAARYAKPLSLALIDLDHFKRVNDTHGHLLGDRVLAEFAERVRETVRTADILVRWGGEEFVLVLPETDAAAARVVAERVRAAVATRTFAGPVAVAQTASIGLGTWRAGETPKALLARVDAAAYDAKAAGRDRVVIA
jgi:diguanylate cyclase (GGDEF)-like protein